MIKEEKAIEEEFVKLKKKERVRFVSPSSDFVIKTIIALGDSRAKQCIFDVLSYVLDKPFVGYELVYNEDGKLNLDFVANRMDLHFLSKEMEEHIILEINAKRTDTYIRKNMSELYKVAGNYYGYNNREIYKRDIQVRLINLNNFHHLKGKYPIEMRYETSSITNEEFDFIKVYDLFLPYFSKVCYHENVKDVFKTIAMIQATSYKEMEELASDSIKRKALYNMVKKMGENPLYMELYDREAFRKAEMEELSEKAKVEGFNSGKEQGYAEGVSQGIEHGIEHGIEQGIEQGIIQAQEDIAKKMILKGYSPEEINEIVDLSLDYIIKLKEDIETNTSN